MIGRGVVGRRHRRRLVVLLALGLPATLAGQQADSALARIERLAVTQQRAEARVLADSLLSALAATDPRYADALYWRAFTSSNAADAERDYLRLSVEFPLAPRAPDGLLALAQLEYARGDRVASRRHFDRLLRDYPTGRHVARASYWSGRLALDEGDRSAACTALERARRSIPEGDVELANQIDYLMGQCAAPPTVEQGAAVPPRDTVAAPAREYSIQVAAYSNRRDATALSSRLKARGFDVRVAGTRAPYRVRIGRYPTRADAVAALGRMRQSQVRGIVVEAEPR